MPAAGSAHTPAPSGPRWRSVFARRPTTSARAAGAKRRSGSSSPAMPHTGDHLLPPGAPGRMRRADAQIQRLVLTHHFLQGKVLENARTPRHAELVPRVGAEIDQLGERIGQGLALAR